MRWSKWLFAGALAVALFFYMSHSEVRAGETSHSEYKVLAPFTSGNLTIFPVVFPGVGPSAHDTSIFLTLDEGLRSGEVVVTEAGSARGLVRRPRPTRPVDGSAQVNTLVLVNNSKRPLLLLAGEIVTGGKQDRVIGKDRIVPPESEPIDLGVFCVEPGRWVAHKDTFGGFSNLAQPSVRANAMAKKDQQMVWDSVRQSRASASESVTVAGAPIEVQTEAATINSTTSYAGVMDNKAVKENLDKIAAPLENDRNVLRELRDKNAVGVVVAVNGDILWTDIFASSDLLNRYWQKLVRSYAAEALTDRGSRGKVTQAEAQAFVEKMQGRHETADTDPGIFRHVEITGDDYRVFELTSLLPKTDYAVHIAKMYEEPTVGNMYRGPTPLQR